MENSGRLRVRCAPAMVVIPESTSCKSTETLSLGNVCSRSRHLAAPGLPVTQFVQVRTKAPLHPRALVELVQKDDQGANHPLSCLHCLLNLNLAERTHIYLSGDGFDDGPGSSWKSKAPRTTLMAQRDNEVIDNTRRIIVGMEQVAGAVAALRTWLTASDNGN